MSRIGSYSGGYLKQGWAVEKPGPKLNIWGRFWSRNSYFGPNLGYLAKQLRKIRASILNGDGIMILFVVLATYVGTILMGLTSKTWLGFLYWFLGTTLVYLSAMGAIILVLGRKLIYARTSEGRTAVHKMIDSPATARLSSETLKKYIARLISLDGELAVVDAARIDLQSAHSLLPEMRTWDALDQLSFHVEAAEKEIDTGGISALRDEMNNEITRLDNLRRDIVARMEIALEKSLQGYDPIVLAERKKLAEQAIASSKKIQ